MKMKDIYTAIESLEAENKTEMVEFLKTKASDSDTLEAKVRTLESDAKQFDGVDLPALKTASEFIETNGGVTELQGHIAKSKGYEDDKATRDAKDAEYKASEERHTKEAQGWQDEKAKMELTSEALAHFSSETGFNTPEILLDYAIGKGFVIKNDTGLCSVVDGATTPFASGGLDKLKEHSSFKGAVRTPDGGKIGGGANGGNTNENKPQDLATQLDSAFSK
jgi:hypothetical protein